jgi:hypothetical protein
LKQDGNAMNAKADPSSGLSQPDGFDTSRFRWSTASAFTGDDDAMGGYTYDAALSDGLPGWLLERVEAGDRTGQHGHGIEALGVSLRADP